jgi:hypothetical protein
MKRQPKFKVRDLKNRKNLSDKEAYINVDDLKTITLYDAFREFNGIRYELLPYTGYRSLDNVDIYEKDIVEIYQYDNKSNDFSTPINKKKLGIGTVKVKYDGMNCYVQCNRQTSTDDGKKHLDKDGFVEYSFDDDELEFKKIGEDFNA